MGFPLLILISLALGAPVAPTAHRAGPCGVNSGATFADQFRCYQSSERNISVPAAGLISGSSGSSDAVCVKGVANDRVQVGRCTTFGVSRMSVVTIPFASILYISDDQEDDHPITVTLLAH